VVSVEKLKKKVTHKSRYWRLEMYFVALALALESCGSQETNGLRESDRGYVEAPQSWTGVSYAFEDFL
jgi:hypothetical protein